jgi:prolyl-tRNA editing enzyme YbaK/EbsC (Cys-tRNA(Pro) deacylase)
VAQVVKAVIIRRSAHALGHGEFAVMVVTGDHKLSLKKVAAALGDKGVRLAAERSVIRVTGYQIGSVSVAEFRRDDIAGYVDRRVLDLPQVIISAGRPDAGLALARCLDVPPQPPGLRPFASTGRGLDTPTFPGTS